MKTLLVKLEVEKRIENLTDLVAGRIYTMDGIDLSKDVTVTLLNDGLEEVVRNAQAYQAIVNTLDTAVPGWRDSPLSEQANAMQAVQVLAQEAFKTV